MTDRELLKSGAAQLGIELSDSALDRFERYSRLLIEYNKRLNLTAITEPREIITKHFLDSMTALSTGLVSGRVIDVGTGAGFPGLVLKIAAPQIELTLLDSLNKRLEFLKTVCAELDIHNVDFVHARAEDAGHSPQLRRSFDTAVSRAVANMRVLSEYCLPFVKTGGYFLALKGPQAANEADEAKRAVAILGGELLPEIQADVPFTDLRHKILAVKKIGETPIKYPRKPAVIAKTAQKSAYSVQPRREL